MEDNNTFRPSQPKKKEKKHVIKSVRGHTEWDEGAWRRVQRQNSEFPVTKAKHSWEEVKCESARARLLMPERNKPSMLHLVPDL